MPFFLSGMAFFSLPSIPYIFHIGEEARVALMCEQQCIVWFFDLLLCLSLPIHTLRFLCSFLESINSFFPFFFFFFFFLFYFLAAYVSFTLPTPGRPVVFVPRSSLPCICSSPCIFPSFSTILYFSFSSLF